MHACCYACVLIGFESSLTLLLQIDLAQGSAGLDLLHGCRNFEVLLMLEEG